MGVSLTSSFHLSLGRISYFFSKENGVTGGNVLYLVAQQCPTLCDLKYCSHQAPLSMGILQAIILEWVATPSSRGSSQPRSLLLQANSLLSEPLGKPTGGNQEKNRITVSFISYTLCPGSYVMKVKVKVKPLSHVRPSGTPRTAAFHAPPSMGFSRQEYWSGVPLPSPYVMKDNQNRVDSSSQNIFFK